MNKQTQQSLLQLVKRNYEEIAEDFSETRNKALWPELVKFTSAVKDGESVLDVGCGNGRLAKLFVERYVKYIGIDNNQRLIEIASKNYELRIKNYEFLVGDILQLDKVVEDKFNYVFCVAVLHHLPGKELRIQALKQLRKRLKPDGKIILTVWNLWPQTKFRKLIIKYSLLKLIGRNAMDWGDILFPWKNKKGEKISERYYHAFALGELKRIIRQTGLDIEKLYQDRYNYYLILKKYNINDAN